MKVAPSIQGDAVRVQGARKDGLQTAINMVRQAINDGAGALQQLPGLITAQAF